MRSPHGVVHPLAGIGDGLHQVVGGAVVEVGEAAARGRQAPAEKIVCVGELRLRVCRAFAGDYIAVAVIDIANSVIQARGKIILFAPRSPVI